MQSQDCWYWIPVAVAVTPWIVSDSRWTVGQRSEVKHICWDGWWLYTVLSAYTLIFHYTTLLFCVGITVADCGETKTYNVCNHIYSIGIYVVCELKNKTWFLLFSLRVSVRCLKCSIEIQCLACCAKSLNMISTASCFLIRGISLPTSHAKSDE